MQKSLDRTMHDKEVQNIDKNAGELQAIITAHDEGSVVVDDKSRNAGAGLEMTTAGAAFGGEHPDAMTSDWVKGMAGRVTSTLKKEVKPRVTPSLPERALSDAPRRSSRKKLNVNDDKGKKTVRVEKKPPVLPFRELGDVKPKKKRQKNGEQGGKEKGKERKTKGKGGNRKCK